MSMVPFLAILIVILGRQVLSTQTGRSEDRSAEEGGGLFSILAWPFKMLAAEILTIFWIVNDAVENVVEGIGRAFSSRQPVTMDVHQAKLQAQARRRRVGIFAGIVLTLLLAFELFPFYFGVVHFRRTIRFTFLQREKMFIFSTLSHAQAENDLI
ncbi:hypothetical protein KFU94_28185 [Chloroflexi bacterium TSY]|nr:hypothetical protein [Chloroflexi bacterium TSY]